MLRARRATRQRDRKLKAAVNMAKNAKGAAPSNDLVGLLPPNASMSFSEPSYAPSTSSAVTAEAVTRGVNKGIRRKSAKFFSRVFRNRRLDTLETSASDASTEEEAVIPKKSTASRENIELVLEKPSEAHREDASETCVDLIGGEVAFDKPVLEDLAPSALERVPSQVSALQTDEVELQGSHSRSEATSQTPIAEDATIASSVGLLGGLGLFGEEDDGWERVEEGVETTEYLQFSPKPESEAKPEVVKKYFFGKQRSADDIWTACRIGDRKFVQKAVKETPEVINQEHEGRTPLYHACHCGHRRIAKLLLEAGAKDEDGTAFKSALNGRMRNLLNQHLEDQEPPAKPLTTVKLLGEDELSAIMSEFSVPRETETAPDGIQSPSSKVSKRDVYSPAIPGSEMSESLEFFAFPDPVQAVPTSQAAPTVQKEPSADFVDNIAITVVAGAQDSYGDAVDPKTPKEELAPKQAPKEAKPEEGPVDFFDDSADPSVVKDAEAIDILCGEDDFLCGDDMDVPQDVLIHKSVEEPSTVMQELADESADAIPDNITETISALEEVRSQERTARVNQVLEDLEKSAEEPTVVSDTASAHQDAVEKEEQAGLDELAEILDQDLADVEPAFEAKMDTDTPMVDASKSADNTEKAPKQPSRGKLGTLKRFISKSVLSARSSRSLSGAEAVGVADEPARAGPLGKLDTMSVRSMNRVKRSPDRYIERIMSGRKKVAITVAEKGVEATTTKKKKTRLRRAPRKDQSSIDGGSLLSVTAGKTATVRYMSHRDGYEDGFEVLLDDYVGFPPTVSNLSTVCNPVPSMANSECWELNSEDDSQESSDGSDVDMIENLDVVRSFSEGSSSESESDEDEDYSGSSASYSGESEFESEGSHESGAEISVGDASDVDFSDGEGTEQYEVMDEGDSAYAEDGTVGDESSSCRSPVEEDGMSSNFCCTFGRAGEV